MDLVDALSSNTTAKSVAELTLNPQFQHTYSALNKAVTVNSLSDQQLARLAAKTIATPQERDKTKLGAWVTPLAQARVTSQENKEWVGALLKDDQLPLEKSLMR